jgi:hypothetical protein
MFIKICASPVGLSIMQVPVARLSVAVATPASSGFPFDIGSLSSLASVQVVGTFSLGTRENFSAK